MESSSPIRNTILYGIMAFFISLIFFNLQTKTTFAASCASTEAGSWGAITWSCGGTPGIADDVTISHAVTLDTGGAITVNSLTIDGTGTLTQNDTFTHNVTGTLLIQSGGTLTHTQNTTTHSYEVDFSASTITIDSGGSINVDGLGYTGGKTSLANGNGPGGGTAGTSGAGGGAHAGNGGIGHGSKAGGTGYCTVSDVNSPGSGGGDGYSTSVGGNGGGLIKLTASGTLTVNGTITADGIAGTTASANGSGGGAGGGVNIAANTITGTPESFTLTGGLAGGTTYDGGGGGGGCALLTYTTSNSIANTAISVIGGEDGGSGGGLDGGGGLAYIKQAGTDGTLYANNNSGITGAGITQGDSTLDLDGFVITNNAIFTAGSGKTITFDDTADPLSAGDTSGLLIIDDGATFNTPSTFTISDNVEFHQSATWNTSSSTDLTLSSTLDLRDFTTATILTFNTVTIASGGILTHGSNTTTAANIINIAATTFTINPGGAINADGKGYQGGQTGQAAGSGPGGGLGSTNGSGAGAHGGDGGAGYGGTAGGTAYCTATDVDSVTDMGSGGGDSYSTTVGGDGGGLIKLNISGTLTVNGAITANGSNGTAKDDNGGGGGAGGGLNLTVGTFAGTPEDMSLAGGNGGAITYSGGGGGGGCGYIGYSTSISIITGDLTVTGGTGKVAGSSGSLSFVQLNTAPSISTSMTTAQQTDDGYVNIAYTLTDADTESDIALDAYEYSLNNTDWSTMTVAGGDGAHSGISSLTGASGGTSNTFVWNACNDISSYDADVWVRFTPNDGTTAGSSAASVSSFAVDCAVPTISSVTAVQDSSATTVTFTYTLSDDNTSDITVALDISNDGGSSWTTTDTSVTGNVGASQTTGSKTISWDAGTDYNGNYEADMQVRIRATDKYQNAGTNSTSANFVLDTKDPANLAFLTWASDTSTTVTPTWIAATDDNFDHYEIWYGTVQNDVENRNLTALEWDNGDDGTLATATTSTTTITGLTEGETYFAKIWAIDSFGNSSTLAAISDATNNKPLVSSISGAQQTDDGYVNISYTLRDNDSNNVSLNLYQYSINGTDWSTMTAATDGLHDGVSGLISSSLGVAHVFVWDAATDLGDSYNATVSFKLQPNDGTENGAAVDTTSSTIAVDVATPASLATLTWASDTSTTATLTWTAATDNNFNHYEIWYGTVQSDVQNRTLTATEWDDGDDATLTTATTSTTTITGLTEGSTYYVKIWAIDNYGNLSTIADITDATNNKPVISAITGAQQTDDGYVNLSYTLTDADTESDIALTSYLYSLDNSTWSSGNMTAATLDVAHDGVANLTGAAGGTANTFVWDVCTDLSVEDSEVYVKLTPNDGTEANSAVTSSAFAVDCAAPAGLGAISASNNTQTSMLLSWTAATDTNFDHYEIWYGTSSSAVASRDAVSAYEYDNSDDATLATATTASISKTGLVAGTTYYFKIWAVDGFGREVTVDSLTASTLQLVGQGAPFITGNSSASIPPVIKDTSAIPKTVEPIEVSTPSTTTPGSEIPTIEPFSDIQNHWAKPYIETLQEANIVSGYTEETFEPDLSITRAEFTKIVVKSFGYDSDTNYYASFHPFIDVSESDWFEPFVAISYTKGLLEGYPDGTFRPNQSITRAEAIKILLTAAKVDIKDYYESNSNTFNITFQDVSKDDWSYPYIAYAENLGIIHGYTPEEFKPDNNITRAEASKIIFFMIQLGLN